MAKVGRKPTPKQPSRPKSPDEALDELLSEAVETLRIAQNANRESIERTIAEIGKSYNDRKQSHLCYLQDAQVKAVAQIRQLQKHRAQQMAELTDEERLRCLLDWLAEQPEHVKEQCRAALSQPTLSVL